jgi:hypothetical protein
MQELTLEDIASVSGAGPRYYDVVPAAQSDWGNRLNDATNMFGEFGSRLGSKIYDWTH